MRIAFDLRRIQNPGIGRYMVGIVETMSTIFPTDRFLLMLSKGGDVYLTVPLQADVVFAKSAYYSFREQYEIPRLLRAWKADILHAPHFVVPVFKVCPTIVTIHDIIHVAYPEDLPSTLARLYARVMLYVSSKVADKIITDSTFSKSEISRYTGVSSKRVTVIPLGVSSHLSRVDDNAEIAALREEIGVFNPFILYVGIYKKRKNHTGLLQALSIIAKRGIKCDLMITGPLKEGRQALEKEAKSLGIADRLHFSGFIPDAKLATLYSAATVYACPSLYEGFGFTILEAAACGTPVVAHRGSSLVEVGGDGVLFANARDPDEFASALTSVLEDEELRQDLVRRGYMNLERFSWEACGRDTHALYLEALEQKK